MKKILTSSPVHAAVLALMAAGSAWSQAQPRAVVNATLPEVTVTGNPLGSRDSLAPVTGYSGTDLLLRAQGTLGETLNNAPGVSSSYFGPNASRPVIRGLDGDRIRILQNGGASTDASSLSFDHAVPVNPLSIERVEVLRGPGALLYGGSAVGGVVNLIDNRIPREAVNGISGKVNLGYSSGASETSTAFLLEGGNDRYALHADFFGREAKDTRVPIALACTNPASPARASRICNSQADAQGGALGGSLLWASGYLGASVTRYQSNYGTVAEDEVTIDLHSTRYAVEGEVRDLGGFIQSVKGQLSYTDYSHSEFEGAEVGTVFGNKGTDFRLEARHQKLQGLGGLEGVFGLQLDNTRFAAVGNEAFVPFTRNQQRALFAYEELPTSFGRLSLGGRVESAQVQSLGADGAPRFAPASRRFTPRSVAAGLLINLTPAWKLTGNVAASERAPRDYELFSNGAHIATAAYELGNAALQKEKSTNVDLGVSWQPPGSAHKFGLNAYVNRFRNYIGLDATGNNRGANGELNPLDANGDGVADGSGEDILPEFAFSAARARFAGLEATGTIRLLQGKDVVDVDLRADIVRARNTATGQPIARIAPLRLGAKLSWAQGPWSAFAGFDYNASQERVPAFTRVTTGYTLVNLGASYQLKLPLVTLLWFAKVDNLTDKLAYSATSVLTTTAINADGVQKAPLPGRSVRVGLQASF
ncbi:MAG: TonB-dependent receptor [Burkholderiales bacterium]